MRKRSERVLRSERGFTLVELGVVMAIIAILAAITYPTYKNIRERAYLAEAKAIMQEIRVEAWAYRVEKEEWVALSDLKAADTTGGKQETSGYDTADWKFAGPATLPDKDEAYDIIATGRGGKVKATTSLKLTIKADGTAVFSP